MFSETEQKINELVVDLKENQRIIEAFYADRKNKIQEIAACIGSCPGETFLTTNETAAYLDEIKKESESVANMLSKRPANVCGTRIDKL